MVTMWLVSRLRLWVVFVCLVGFFFLEILSYFFWNSKNGVQQTSENIEVFNFWWIHPSKLLVSGVSPTNQGESLFQDPIREKNWDVKKGKKSRGRFIPLLCPPWRKEVHYWSALLILLAAADTQWGADAVQSGGGRRAGRARACHTALPYIFLPPFFLLCLAPRSAATQRAVSYQTVNTIDGRKAPSRWASQSEWISRGYCLQSDAARLLWYCDSTAKPLSDGRRACWRTTLDLISVLLCSSWWDFAIKSGLFSYKQTSITAPTRVISPMLIYLIIDCEISLIVYFF